MISYGVEAYHTYTRRDTQARSSFCVVSMLGRILRSALWDHHQRVSSTGTGVERGVTFEMSVHSFA